MEMWNDVAALFGSETLKVLLALLPGLLTVAVLRSLTIREVLSPLERIVQALLFTFLAHVSWQIIVFVASVAGWIGLGITDRVWEWRSLPVPVGISVVGLAVCGLGWGLFMSWMTNSDRIHGCLRRWGQLTKKSSRPNEWYDTFYRWENYVVVHLKDGRRIFGWPRLYPDNADEGHLVLEDAEWLYDDSKTSTTSERVHIMIRAGDVTIVEFVPSRIKEDSNAHETNANGLAGTDDRTGVSESSRHQQ